MVKRYDWRPLERERVRALMSHDAGEYARLCYELGMEAEDKELYAQGALPEYNKLNGLEQAVDDIEIKPLNRRKRSVSNAVYREFHAEAIKLSTNFFGDTNKKMRLLEEYFPNKGCTDGMSPRQIGSKFVGMLKYTKSRIAEQTR